MDPKLPSNKKSIISKRLINGSIKLRIKAKNWKTFYRRYCYVLMKDWELSLD